MQLFTSKVNTDKRVKCRYCKKDLPDVDTAFGTIVEGQSVTDPRCLTQNQADECPNYSEIVRESQMETTVRKAIEFLFGK